MMGRAATSPGTPKRTRKLMSVYPRDWAKEIVGRMSVPLNRAIECWAQVVGWASADNEASFTEEEFTLVADVCSQFEFDPHSPAPGKQIALLLGGSAWGARLAQHPTLLKRIEKLDYVHAWAILLACHFREAYSNRQWWKLATRRQ